MSHESRNVVRQPIAVRPDSHRRLEERLALRFPGALTFLARSLWRLLPRSRLRAVIVGRALQLGLEATNRGDFEAAFALYHPDVEPIATGKFDALGFDPVYRGREERVRFQQRWIVEWGEFRFEPEAFVDLTDRLLIVGRVRGSGLASGAPIDNDWALLLEITAGRVIREHVFWDRAEALEAAGLS